MGNVQPLPEGRRGQDTRSKPMIRGGVGNSWVGRCQGLSQVLWDWEQGSRDKLTEGLGQQTKVEPSIWG